MESTKAEAAFLEEAVCQSQNKELSVFCHAQSGRGWVEVGGRRFVGKNYVQAARRMHAHQTLALKSTGSDHEVFELGHHSCTRAAR